MVANLHWQHYCVGTCLITVVLWTVVTLRMLKPVNWFFGFWGKFIRTRDQYAKTSPIFPNQRGLLLKTKYCCSPCKNSDVAYSSHHVHTSFPKQKTKLQHAASSTAPLSSFNVITITSHQLCTSVLQTADLTVVFTLNCQTSLFFSDGVFITPRKLIFMDPVPQSVLCGKQRLWEEAERCCSMEVGQLAMRTLPTTSIFSFKSKLS